MRWAGHVAHVGDSKDSYRILVGKPEGRRSLRRSRRRWKYNIEMDLVIGWGINWIDLLSIRRGSGHF